VNGRTCAYSSPAARIGRRWVAWATSGALTGSGLAGSGGKVGMEMTSCGAGEPGGRTAPTVETVSGSSRGSGIGGAGVPSRAAGGGLAQLAGPAATTFPAGDRLVQSGTVAVHDTSAGGGFGPASAAQTKTVNGPTGGPPFGTILIGRPTGTRPPKPGCY
jgi:hypothetical protein